jgi:hypothetical protein
MCIWGGLALVAPGIGSCSQGSIFMASRVLLLIRHWQPPVSRAAAIQSTIASLCCGAISVTFLIEHRRASTACVLFALLASAFLCEAMVRLLRKQPAMNE